MISLFNMYRFPSIKSMYFSLLFMQCLSICVTHAMVHKHEYSKKVLRGFSTEIMKKLKNASE